jgi:hypothetical protein
MQIKLQIAAFQCINPVKPYVQPDGIRTDDLFVPEMDAVPRNRGLTDKTSYANELAYVPSLSRNRVKF